MEIELAQVEMPGLMSMIKEFGPSQPLKGANVSGSLHMTIQTAVLIETLVALGANVRWCSCNIFSTQDHAAAAIVRADVRTCSRGRARRSRSTGGAPRRRSPGRRPGPEQIVDDGGDATLLLHEGKKFEIAHAKDGSLPDPSTTDNAEFKCVLKTIKASIDQRQERFHKMVDDMVGVSEETTTGVTALIQMADKGELLFPAINVNDCVTKSQVRQRLRLPPLAAGRHHARDGRHARGQEGRHLRLRRRRQGLRRSR